MGRFEQSLTKHWRSRVAEARLRPRQGTGLLQKLWLAFVHAGYFRILLWGAAASGTAARWEIAALLATMQALFQTCELLGRGYKEFQLSIYGASDAALLEPTRRAQRKRIILAVVDAVAILGIWLLGGKIPAWTLIMGVPAFAFAVFIGPRLLAAIIPSKCVPLVVATTFLGFPLMVFISAKGILSRDLTDAIFLIAGSLSPAGWVVVMLRGLLEGRIILLGGLLLLATGYFLARTFAQSQDEKLVGLVTEGDVEKYIETAEAAREGMEPLVENDPSERLSAPIGPGLKETFLATGQTDLLDLPGSSAPRGGYRKKAIWTAAIVLGIATFGRPEFLGGTTSHLLLGFSLLFTYWTWLPFGLPAWFQPARIATNRVCPKFAVFPISLRSLLAGQIKRDLQQAVKALPLLTLLTFGAVQIAISPDWTASLSFAATTSLAAFLFLPLRWFRLARGFQSQQPFRLSFLLNVGMIIVMGILFSLQIVVMIFSVGVGLSGISDNFGSWHALAGLFLGISAINAMAGFIGLWIGIRAFEGERYDVVRNPPKDS